MHKKRTMPFMKKLVLIVAVLVVSVIGFGYAENYYGTPLHGCTKTDGGAGYWDYTCGSKPGYLVQK